MPQTAPRSSGRPRSPTKFGTSTIDRLVHKRPNRTGASRSDAPGRTGDQPIHARLRFVRQPIRLQGEPTSRRRSKILTRMGRHLTLAADQRHAAPLTVPLLGEELAIAPDDTP